MASHVVALRLDGDELTGLDELVKRQNLKLRELRLPAVVTRATYLRSLLLRELEALGHRAVEGLTPVKPESLTLMPPRKRLRRNVENLPAPVTVERKVSKEDGRRTIWECILADDIIDDAPPKGGNRK